MENFPGQCRSVVAQSHGDRAILTRGFVLAALPLSLLRTPWAAD